MISLTDRLAIGGDMGVPPRTLNPARMKPGHCRQPLPGFPGEQSDAHNLLAAVSLDRVPAARLRCGSVGLKGAQKSHQVLFLLLLELRAEDQVEELDRVLQGQEALVVEIGRVVLNPAQRESFD